MLWAPMTNVVRAPQNPKSSSFTKEAEIYHIFIQVKSDKVVFETGKLVRAPVVIFVGSRSPGDGIMSLALLPIRCCRYCEITRDTCWHAYLHDPSPFHGRSQDLASMPHWPTGHHTIGQWRIQGEPRRLWPPPLVSDTEMGPRVPFGCPKRTIFKPASANGSLNIPRPYKA